MTWQGVYTAMVTPFQRGEIDWPALDRLVDSQLSANIDGLVLCGTTGESPTLSDSEKDSLIRHVKEQVGDRCPIIAGTGCNCTRKTLTQSQRAIEAGADAVMLVSPYYNKPTQTGLYEHFSAVAKTITKPIWLYNIPGRCGVTIEEETIQKLHDRFNHIEVVKHATGSVEGVTSLRRRCRITILSGDDPLTWPMMSAGAQGVVSVVSNLWPGRVKDMVEAALSGEMHRARSQHEALYPQMKMLLSLETNPIPIKTALAIRGMIQEEFRLPMCKMSAPHREQLHNMLMANEEMS